MRTHAAPSCNLRPSLDLLEDRHLLSGGFEAIGVSPPAAIVVAIKIRDQPHAVEVTGLPSGPPTFRGGLFSQTSSGPLAFVGGLSAQMPSDPPAFVGGLSAQMSPSWGNLAFAVRNPFTLFAPGHAFQVHSDTQNPLFSSDSQTTSEFQEPSTGAPTYLSMTVSSTDATSQGPPPPGAPPPMPGLPPGAFPPLDLFRFKVQLDSAQRIRSQASARGQCWKRRRG